ncbi:Oidioi.mRNA.OKI2018_I69.XSR.g13971.t1.cds [Oikopleura dioica]|uniref:Oidioi.mRNA.OKI2018_I69.XSR.g13971.t1.cds n=1 Tax=Oikopleura dioica TaxID=34765 RepID=A0ABN7SEN8_OIKDI|nr:Oidioi.mRNA.OKI2018_I69.XSR.g13971.t1.cds [Oikopleura dioica]
MNRKRPSERSDEPDFDSAPSAKRIDLLTANREQLNRFLETNITGLAGYTASAVEKFIHAVKQKDNDEVILSLRILSQIIDDVGRPAAIEISKSPRNLENCLSLPFSQKVNMIALQLISTLINYGVVPDMEWTSVYVLFGKANFFLELKRLVHHYLLYSGMHVNPNTALLSNFLQILSPEQFEKDFETLELFHSKVLANQEMSKTSKLSIFKDLTLKSLGRLWLKVSPEFKPFLSNMLLLAVDHEHGAALDQDLLQKEMANFHFMSLLTSIRKGDELSINFSAEILARREELIPKYFFPGIDLQNVTHFQCVLEKLEESDSILKKKRLRGDPAAVIECIKKQTFGLFKKEEFEALLAKQSKMGSYKDVAALIRVYPLLLARVHQLLGRIDHPETQKNVQQQFQDQAVDLLPQGMALNSWLNRILLSIDKSETNRRKIDENLISQTMVMLKSIDEFCPFVLAPVKFESFISKMTSCERSTIILLELIDKRRDSILFFKGKKNAFSELVLIAQSEKSSMELKGSACEVLSKLLAFPSWPLISSKIKNLEEIAKDITSDTTSAGWLSELKSLISPRSSDTPMEVSRLPSSPLPKIIVKLIEKDNSISPEVLAIFVAWSIVKRPELTLAAIFDALRELANEENESIIRKCEKLWIETKKSKNKKRKSGCEAPECFDNLSKFIFYVSKIEEANENVPLLTQIASLIEDFSEIEAHHLVSLLESTSFQRNFLKSEFSKNYLFTVLVENKLMKQFCMKYFNNSGLVPPKTLWEHFDTRTLRAFEGKKFSFELEKCLLENSELLEFTKPCLSWSEKLLLRAISNPSISIQTADLLESALKKPSKSCKMSELQICQILGNGGFLERVKTLPQEFTELTKNRLKEKLAMESYDDLNELKILCSLIEVEAMDNEEAKELLKEMNLRNKELSEEGRMNILLVLQILGEEEDLWEELPKLSLSIYTCSTSPLDREINSFINKIFSRSKLIYRHRPFLFGSSSSSSHESNESSRILTTDHSRAFLENLDRERMQKTMINFGKKDDSCVYDPAFMLFALCDLVRADAQVDPKLLISSGAFSFCIMALTLEDDKLRSVALESLFRIKDHLIIYRWSNFNLIASFFLFLEEILEPEKPLKSAVAVYFSRAIHLMIKPEHEMYQTMMASVVHMESFSDSVPDFIDFFWAHSNTKRKRLWIINFMEEMLIHSSDVTSLYHYHALDSVLAALNTDDPRLYESVLRLVEKLIMVDPLVIKKKGVANTIHARQKLKKEKLKIEERILKAVHS